MVAGSAVADEDGSRGSGGSVRLARSVGVIGVAVLVSRVLGLVREQVFAGFFGAGRELDAFITAFRIPNLFRDLFAEGALSAAFVTSFAQKLERDGEASAWRLANLVIHALVLVVGGVVAVGILAAPWLVRAIAPGFREIPGKMELTVLLTRIMFPFLLLVALAAVAMGMLNAKDRFGVAASASSFFNLGSVAIGLGCAWWFSPDYMGAMWHGNAAGRAALPPTAIERAILGMALGTLAGGALQLIVQLPSLYRLHYRYRPLLSFRDPGVRQVLALMAPATIGAAAVQVNVLVNSNFASYLGDGPVSWLNVAFRFMQLPIGLFGVAVGTVALPSVSRSAARDNMSEFRQTIVRALRMVFCLTIPAAVGLAVLAPEAIGLVYQHGRFGPHDTQMAARALVAYSLGLAGYANIKVLVPAFYALDDARTPMLVSLLSIGVNTLLNWLTIHWLGLGHTGLALATSAVALLNFAILLVIIRRRIGALPGLGAAIGRIGVAAAALGLVCLGLKQGIGILLPPGSFNGRMLIWLLALPGGAIAFILVAGWLGLSEIGLLLRPLRRWRVA